MPEDWMKNDLELI